MVEQLTVNQLVVSSSLTGGAFNVSKFEFGNMLSYSCLIRSIKLACLVKYIAKLEFRNIIHDHISVHTIRLARSNTDRYIRTYAGGSHWPEFGVLIDIALIVGED